MDGKAGNDDFGADCDALATSLGRPDVNGFLLGARTCSVALAEDAGVCFWNENDGKGA